jgi:predicted ester cyclase
MSTEQNKELIKQYNEQVIAQGDMEWFMNHSSPEFINHSAQEGMPKGREGMIYFFTQVLHTSFSNVQVAVKDMVASENKVATRKEITGVHSGKLMDIAPTGRPIAISVMDIMVLKDGKITDHWGETNFAAVLQSLQQ